MKGFHQYNVSESLAKTKRIVDFINGMADERTEAKMQQKQTLSQKLNVNRIKNIHFVYKLPHEPKMLYVEL